MEDRRLPSELERRFGLRHVRVDWMRRQMAFSADELQVAICGADLGTITQGTSPWNVHDAHAICLGTRMLVQIEDIINIANTNSRAVERPTVMQMTLNDGYNEFVGVELEPWPNRVSLSTLPGTKIVLEPSARVMRGRMLLRERDFFVLGSAPNNIWGQSYDSAVAEVQRDAGIPDTETNSSLARVLHGRHAQDIVQTIRSSHASTFQTNFLLQNMGGIADPSLVVDDETARENDTGVGLGTEQSNYRAGLTGTRLPVSLGNAEIPEVPDSDMDN